MEDKSSGALSRRSFLKIGSAGIATLAFGDLPGANAESVAPTGKARSVIQIWLGGGPTHLDTFDPKPEAGSGYCGPFTKPIPTGVPGVRICEMLPLMAKQGNKYTIIRSMTHNDYGHETATYKMQTSTMPSADLVYPAVGAVVSLKKGYEAGYKGLLPPYITLTSPLGRFSEAGFLGADYATFATGGSPASKGFTIEGIVPPASLTAQRLQDRRGLLQSIDSLGQDADPSIRAVSAYQQRAYEMVSGEARKAFDLSVEKDDLRKRYGMNHFGQCCLLARRLVEYGVPYITINYGGWDTHVDNFAAMHRLLPPLDGGFATLLDDLAQHGLLDSTIVVCYGEFGRSPKISYEEPWNGGRHHHGAVFSAVVAGGGFRGGAVVGSSDAKGMTVKTRPVYPWDLSASMYQLLGIDPMGRLPHPQGCVAYVTPLASGVVPSGGLLTEIM